MSVTLVRLWRRRIRFESRFHEHEWEIRRAVLGELKWERLLCRCPVAMGVYSVEEALAKTIRTNALARTTGMQDEKTT